MELKKFNEFLDKKTIVESELVKETINEAAIDNEYNEIMLRLIQDNLPVLETMIKKETGYFIKLKAEISLGQYSSVSISITSDDILKGFGSLGPAIFKSINLYFWGGNISDNPEKAEIWFSPNVSYDHTYGGSNGCKFIWDTLWINKDSGKWTARK